jgi:hypothetical protein
MSLGLMSRTWKWEHVIGREQTEKKKKKKCTKGMVLRNRKNEEKI